MYLCGSIDLGGGGFGGRCDGVPHLAVISGTFATAVPVAGAVAPFGGDVDIDALTTACESCAGIAEAGTGVLADVVRGELKPGRFVELPGGADRETLGMWLGGW
jgi:hypothetical protein